MVVYRAGDCFLQNSDVGFGRVDGSAVACRARNDDGTPGDRIEQWAPITGGSSYYENDYSTVWAHDRHAAAVPEHLHCDTAAGQRRRPQLVADRPGRRRRDDLEPDHVLAARQPAAHHDQDGRRARAPRPGAADGYTITVQNPNDTAVSLSSITDTLPAGFTYTAGSSTGATTSDPSISGST